MQFNHRILFYSVIVSDISVVLITGATSETGSTTSLSSTGACIASAAGTCIASTAVAGASGFVDSSTTTSVSVISGAVPLGD